MAPLPSGEALFVYEIFYENKGKVLSKEIVRALHELLDSKHHGNRLQTIITRLTDYYGCDIRHFGTNQWSLVGEHVGKVYVDYTQKEKV